jgi:hypothetical protein
VGHVIGDVRNGKRPAHSRNLGQFLRNPLKAALPFSCQRVVIFPELQFECLYHSDNFFLASFLAAASRVLMRLLLSRA